MSSSLSNLELYLFFCLKNFRSIFSMMYRNGTNIVFNLFLLLKYNVYMHMCIHVCMHMCVCMCVHVCVYACVHTCVYVCHGHVEHVRCMFDRGYTCPCMGVWRPEFSLWHFFCHSPHYFSRNGLTLNLMIPCLARLETPGIFLSLIHQYWGHKHFHIWLSLRWW